MVMEDNIIPKPLRDRVLLGTRIKVAFIAINVILVAALSALTIFSVDRIFRSLTPVHEQNLRWKVERGAKELSRAVDLAVLLADPALIHAATLDYEADGELQLLLVQDASGKVLYRHQIKPVSGDLFANTPVKAHLAGSTLRAWSDVMIEGTSAGKVAVVFSTHKLQAGRELRSDIIWGAILGCLAALIVSVGFVMFYVRPLVQGTQSAFLQLEKKTIEALDASRVKGEFLANMSHEIRTPLNSIVGLAGLMVRGELMPTQRRRAEMISGSSQSLLEIINDVLDFSRLEAGKYEIHPDRCDIRTLVQDRVELMAVRAQAKQLEVVYRVAPEVPNVVCVDGSRVAQVLTNLVGNAVKFTDTGEVRVRVAMVEGASGAAQRPTLRFEVTDTGVGIDASKINRLFQSFSQVDGSLTRAHEGSGLGLAISKQLVELMGGEIGVNSSEGAGSTFWFTLPCDVIEESSRPIENLPSPASRRVLVVDESASVREALVERMSAWGMEVLEAASSRDAVIRMRESRDHGFPVHFAIVDSKLTNDVGEPLWKSLRRGSDEALRVVILAPGSWGDHAKEEGVFHVSKPVRASDLYNCLAGPSVTVRLDQKLANSGTRSGHFLVVDDNHVNRVVAEDTLQELGHTCDLARDGSEGVEKALLRKYDAILMDCQMPGMNGYQATNEIRIRELPLGRRTPIIALTAHAFQGERDKARAAGMDDFLTKPASTVVLRRTLERWALETQTSSPANDNQGTLAEATPASEDQTDGQELVREQKRSIRLIEAFLGSAPEQVTRLVELCEGTDVKELRAASHKLKGSAWSLGAMRMGVLCEAIQLAADANDLTLVPQLGSQVKSVFQQTYTYLEAELAQRKPAVAANE